MKKLFTLWTLLLCFVAGAWAQGPKVTIDFTGETDVWGIGTTKTVEENSFTHDGITIKLAGTEGNGYRWYDSGNIILGQEGATLTLPAFDFAVSEIHVEGTSTASQYVLQNIYVGENAVSTETKGAKDKTNVYAIAPEYQAAGNVYVLKVTSAHNTQIRTIKIYEKSSVEKPVFDPAAGTYAGTQSINITCATEGAKIYYTLDGTPPSEASTEYTKPVEITESATLKAIAVKDGAVSILAEATYAIIESIANTKATAYDVSKAIELTTTKDASVLAHEGNKVYVKGTIKSISGVDIEWGDATYTITDGLNDLLIYQGLYLDGAKFTEETKDELAEGKNVIIYGNLKYYKEQTPEMDKGNYLVDLKYPPEDIFVFPAENSDIYEAVQTASEGKNVKDIYVYLESGKKFTISQTIVAPAAFIIMGAAPGTTDPSTIDGSTAMAEIDATALSGPVVQMSETPAVEADGNGFYPLSDVGFINVKITNLKDQLFYANKQKYAISTFHVDYCNIHMAGGSKTLIDTNGGGVIGDLDMAKNTIWAEPAHSGQLYSSQQGQKATEAGFETQKFGIERNTFYNISYNKNICTHRQANQTWIEYFVQNNVFVNTGKNGQAIKGLNGGQGGPNPTWKVNGNAFNFDGADTSANEETGDADEPVQNSIAGVFVFNDAANGDFNGVFKGLAAEAPAKYPGDPRWTYTYEAPVDFYIIGGPKEWKLDDMTKMTFNETTQAYEFEYAPTTTAYFAFSDKQFTAEEAAAADAWDTFDATNRYALGEGDVNATLNEAVALQKGKGTIVLGAVKEGTTYKISVAKDFSTVTIAGEAAPIPTIEKLYIMGTGTPGGWNATTELTFNETNQAFEYEANVTEDTYLTFGDAEWTSWNDFNGKHRFAPGEGNKEPTLGQATQLILVNDGNVLLKTHGTYKISVTKDLVMTVTSSTTAINGIEATAEEANTPIYNLSGQKVTKSYKGVVIQGGKKFINK